MKTALIIALGFLAATPAAATEIATPALRGLAEAHAEGSVPKLTLRERAALMAVLKAAPKSSITVACGGAWCRDVASQIAAIFYSADWSVKTVSRGGIGVDGVSGIRVTSCGVSASALADAIRAITPRKVESESDGSCGSGAPRIFLIVGTPEK